MCSIRFMLQMYERERDRTVTLLNGRISAQSWNMRQPTKKNKTPASPHMDLI